MSIRIYSQKSLTILKGKCPIGQDPAGSRQSARQGPSTQSRVYDKTCIFCLSPSKYIRGSNSRESLNVASELRPDKTVREIATERSDETILAVTSRDIVAAKAHYHTSCYKAYTRKRTTEGHN